MITEALRRELHEQQLAAEVSYYLLLIMTLQYELAIFQRCAGYVVLNCADSMMLLICFSTTTLSVIGTELPDCSKQSNT